MNDCKTINQALYRRAEQSPAQIALKYKDKGRWHYYRWTDALQVVESLAAKFLDWGNTTGDRIAIICNTCPEWFLTDMATMAIQNVVVPIYPTLLEDDIEFIINDSQPRILVVEDKSQLEKWETIKSNCPSVQHIVVINSSEVAEGSNIWADVVKDGRALHKENSSKVKDLTMSAEPDQIASILYTSGTTGRPKGVVLAHEQIMSELTDVFHAQPVTEKDLTLTFLPFAHILGRVESWGSIYAGYTLGFAESIERIRANLQELKPTFIIGVPRIFEKLYTAILAHVETKPAAKRLFHIAAQVGKEYADCRMENRSVPWNVILQHQVYDKLVFENVRKNLGGRIRFCISGGAPLASEIARFFYGCGILVLEGYGLTETTAGITFNTPLRYKFGTVGPALADVDLRIAEDGEILVKSKKVMKGYYNNEEATKEAFEDDYFKTGDIGEVDSDGFLRITDRKKDLIKTAGGKYVAPQRLEGLLKLSPYISNVLIHGDQRKFVSALITLDEVHIKQWAKQHDLPGDDLHKNSKVRVLIKDAVAEANSQLSSFESIKKFAILEKDFTVETGELTPSLKVKRKLCDDKFKTEIDALYD